MFISMVIKIRVFRKSSQFKFVQREIKEITFDKSDLLEKQSLPGSQICMRVLLNFLNDGKESSSLLSRPLCLLKQSGPTEK